ncbi:MAG: cohesin domain-containing protein [Bacteroidota bacterium]
MKFTSILLFAFVCTLFFSCEKEQDLSSINNAIDPSSKDYIKPVTTFGGTLNDGMTISVSSVTVAFTGTRDVIAFQYALDGGAWSPDFSEGQLTVSDLDEGSHTVSVRAKHKDGTYEENPPKRTFIVNAIPAQSIWFYPRALKVSTGQTITYQIRGEEISSVAGAKLTFTYDPSQIEIVSANDLTGSLFKKNGLDATVQLLTPSSGKMVINLALLAQQKGVAKQVTGSDVILSLSIRAKVKADAIITFVKAESSLRDSNNVPLGLNEMVNGKLVIQ